MKDLLSAHLDREQARDHLTTATAMYRDDMDIRFWLTKAEEELTLGG